MTTSTYPSGFDPGPRALLREVVRGRLPTLVRATVSPAAARAGRPDPA